jgi:hypothetical protein
VKRLLILLIVLAGGLAAASFAVPTNAATVNGTSISQSTFISDVSAVANNHLFSCFLNDEQIVTSQGQDQEPQISGVGLASTSGPFTTANADFVSSFLNTEIDHQVIEELAAQHHLVVTPSQLTKAKSELATQVNEVLQEVSQSQFASKECTTTLTGTAELAQMPASLVAELVQFEATLNNLYNYQSGVGTSTLALQRYFYEHNAEFNTACFTVSGYSSLADAQAAIAKVNAGTPFSTVAGEVPGGGPQGCDILYGIATTLPKGNGLETLPLNTVSKPIVEGSSYLVIEITSRTQTKFTKALSEVKAAVLNVGVAKARPVIAAAERRANVIVDPRDGTWNPAATAVLPPVSPDVVDLLNPTVDTPATPTTTPAPATSSTGTSP